MKDIQKKYRSYLKKYNLAPNTVSTSTTDAFYLWRNVGETVFWRVVKSDDFDVDARAYLSAALNAFSSGKHSNINGYLSHLRRFREFAAEQEIVKTEACVPEPSEEQVRFYLNLWNELENYTLQENALDKLFHQVCPRNDTIEDILIKASTLNDFYSTNIFSIYPVAKHILQAGIDAKLYRDDVSVVNDIRRVTIGGKERDFYSFATKYCSHHRDEAFPIYDSYVDTVLRYFRKNGRISFFKNDELKDYARFKEILLDFRSVYGLGNYSLKEIDKYLWKLGKDCFPKSY